MTGEKIGCMHGLVMEYCRRCRVERMAASVGVQLDPGREADIAAMNELHEINSQLRDKAGDLAGTTDKPDPKNVRGDWFNPFGGEDNAQSLRNFQASLDARSRQAFQLAQEVNDLRGTVRDRDCEIRVLRQACKAAGDEIRELKAQRKPVRHGAYYLTFPEYGPSAGMYWAGGLALLFLGACFAWVIK